MVSSSPRPRPIAASRLLGSACSLRSPKTSTASARSPGADKRCSRSCDNPAPRRPDAASQRTQPSYCDWLGDTAARRSFACVSASSGCQPWSTSTQSASSAERPMPCWQWISTFSPQRNALANEGDAALEHRHGRRLEVGSRADEGRLMPAARKHALRRRTPPARRSTTRRCHGRSARSAALVRSGSSRRPRAGRSASGSSARPGFDRPPASSSVIGAFWLHPQ